MSPLIKNSSVESVLATADIVDVISSYTSLRKRGSTFTGLCPFHQEKTPSFSVSADKGLYYCFGCGEGGGVLTFLQRKENLSFVEAVETLAERFGVTLEYEEGGGRDQSAVGQERRLFELLQKAARFYQRVLWESKEGLDARTYLEGRGLGREVCDEFQVGLAPAGWRRLHAKALAEGFTERELESAGLLVRQPGKTYDRFRGRLMFPLVDRRGRVAGFGGRTLADETPKYLNSSEGPVYRKGQLLYGLYQARRAIAQADEVLVVEGYTDVLAMVQADVRNVVASMGTALTEGQLAAVSPLTRNVSFMFDADRAGTEAALRSGELARAQQLHAMVVTLPTGEDPADAAKRGGAEGIRRLVAGRTSLLAFQIRRVLDKHDLATADGRVRAFELVGEILSRATPKEREEQIRTIADRLRLAPENMALLLRTGGRGGPGRGQVAAEGVTTSRQPASSRAASLRDRLLSPEVVVEREFLVAAVCNPVDARPLMEQLDPDAFSDPVHRGAFEALREALGSADPRAAIARHAQGDSDVGRFFVRLAIEAEGGLHGSAVLRSQYWRLYEQRLTRSIAELTAQLDNGELDEAGQRHRLKLVQMRDQVRPTMLADAEEG
jgi:DNA primase